MTWFAFVLFVFTWTIEAGSYGDAVAWLLFGSLPTLLWVNRVTNPERP